MRRILLIEDEPHISEAIRFILSRDGWSVETHVDGATAVEAIRQAEPAVVILDVMLPNRSGFDILRELRQDARVGAVPVLMLTARGQARDQEMALACGASRFMAKPFSNDEVLASVNELAAAS